MYASAYTHFLRLASTAHLTHMKTAREQIVQTVSKKVPPGAPSRRHVARAPAVPTECMVPQLGALEAGGGGGGGGDNGEPEAPASSVTASAIRGEL